MEREGRSFPMILVRASEQDGPWHWKHKRSIPQDGAGERVKGQTKNLNEQVTEKQRTSAMALENLC